MQIEVNRDIDKFKESVILGLTARQLLYSVLSVGLGGGVVFLVYPYVGLTTSAYIAVPVVAPIALTGFYSFNGMTFVEMMKAKIHFMVGNRPLTYVSTEDEAEIDEIRREIAMEERKKNKKTLADRLLSKKKGKDE